MYILSIIASMVPIILGIYYGVIGKRVKTSVIMLFIASVVVVYAVTANTGGNALSGGNISLLGLFMDLIGFPIIVAVFGVVALFIARAIRGARFGTH